MDRHVLIKYKSRTGASYPTVCMRGGRLALAGLFNDFEYKRGAEIGVRAGGYSKTICEQVPGVELFSIDPWKAYNRLNQERQEAYYRQAMEALAPHKAIIMRMPSLEAVDRFEDRSLDFVFIDGDHAFDEVMQDIIRWARKVRVGGIVAGHDYGNFPEVTMAVHTYIQCHRITPWYITRDNVASFFWIVK